MAHAPIRKKSHDHDIHKFQGKESILTSQINIYVEEAKPKIPDGGWGWMIVLSAFILNTISEGISFSFGLLYIDFLHEFGASKSATSWIGSLFLAVPLLAGPIGSAMVDRYGCLYMTVLGSLVCTAGFILSVFAKSIGVLYITFGIIGGIGRGLTFVTAVVSIAFWFEKRRTIALGLAASGAGFGTIIFAPFTTFLLFEFGWRGTMLILAGCFSNMCVCGVMMRDPDWILEEVREKKAIKLTKKAAAITAAEGANSKFKEMKKSLKKGDTQFSLHRVNTSVELCEKNRFSSVIDLPTYLKENEKVPLEVLKQLSENKQLYKIIFENYPNLLAGKTNSEHDLHARSDATNQLRLPVKFSMQLKKTEETIPEVDEAEENGVLHDTRSPLIRSESNSKAKSKTTSHGYLNQMKMKRNSVEAKNHTLNKYRTTATSCPDVYRNTVTSVSLEDTGKWYLQFFRGLKNLLNFSLFLELHFFLMSLSTIILFVWFIVPYFYLAEHMTRNGYTDEQASFGLSAIGFTNTIGMVFLGWAGNWLNIAKTYAVCLILCGISTACIMLFTHNYVLLILSSALYGLFFASCFCLLPSLLAELVPLEDFTMAYGLILLCEGVGNLVGPPLAGFLFDLTGSWDQSFYQAAFWIIICGLLIGIIPYTKNRKMLGSRPILLEKENTKGGVV